MDFLFFGELMLRLTPARIGERLALTDTLHMTPGGSEANSAVALKSIGIHNASLLSAFPDNPLGENCINKLKSFGVSVINLPSNSQRVGLYMLDKGVGPRSSEVYYDRMNSAFCMIAPESILKEHLVCEWFHSSGITPAISEQACLSLFHCLDVLSDKIPFSLDFNYRSKLWKWTDKKRIRSTFYDLCSRALLLTGNEDDFHKCLGLKVKGNTTKETYSNIASEIFLKFKKTKYIAVSLRESHSATRNSWSGMLFVRTVNNLETFVGPRVEIDSIVDRLGTGDCFTAGILHGLASFEDDYNKTINFAVMLSALKHTIYGDFSSITEKDVLKALKSSGKCNIVR